MIVRAFKRLVENGYIYRGLRPVLWSPSVRTALADTETVYQDVVSKAITVAFPLKDDPNNVFEGLGNAEAVIWTTTPWTIPANLGVAFHPKMVYTVVDVAGRKLLLADLLVDKVMQECGFDTYTKVKQFKGEEIERVVFSHPIYGRDSLAVLADYVTTEDGTGVVHTAPGHGRDDFYTGQRYGLDVLCPVDERGVLTEEAGEFAGVFYKKCDTVVVDRLREVGALLHEADYHHSYPHAERDGQPVIFRATDQWFIGIDRPFHRDPSHTLRQQMLKEIEHVQWVPESGHSRIKAMVENRTDWCISRQRPWGVAIPVFYGSESGVPVLDPVAIEAVAQMVEQQGQHGWHTKSANEILPAGYVHPETGETKFRKETDVFDVWFDSACTHLAVYEGDVHAEWKEDLPVDLYLEGSDQHRGWFNVSLIVGTATRGHAPYKAVMTHGFVLDGQGRKMAKRLGNVIDPVAAASSMGAEILRYWVASVNYSDDMPCSDDLLKTAGDNYRSVRNTLRFLLANIGDFDPSAPYELSLFDRWVMQESDRLSEKVVQAYREYEFTDGLTLVHHFCVNELSRFYLDFIKDRMYCDGADWPTRRGVQHACHYVLDRLVRLIAPVLMHTAEEVYAMLPGEKLASVHMETFLPSKIADDPTLRQSVETLLQVRARVAAEHEKWKSATGLKDSQDAEALVPVTKDEHRALASFDPTDIALAFRMAKVTFQDDPTLPIEFHESAYAKCDRSRVRRADVAPSVWEGEQVMLTARDRRALGIA